MRVTYRYVRPCAVLYVRCTGAYAGSVTKAWHDMTGWLEACSIRNRIGRGVGIFHDDPTITAPEALRYDACVIAADAALDADPGAGVGRQTLAGGAYAVHPHTGPYEATGDLLSGLRREAVAKRGLSIDYGRPFMAFYLNDPMLTRESYRRTELCVPVVPIRMPPSSNDEGAQADIADARDRRFRA